jgi:hypothetical protein
VSGTSGSACGGRCWEVAEFLAGFVVLDSFEGVLADLVLDEEDGELDLAGAGAAVLAFPLPPGGLLRRHGDAGAVDGGVELAGQRGRRERDHLPGGDEPGALAAGGRERGA